MIEQRLEKYDEVPRESHEEQKEVSSTMYNQLVPYSQKNGESQFTFNQPTQASTMIMT